MSRLSLLYCARASASAPPIPPADYNVSSMVEFIAAVDAATAAGGNATISVADGGAAEYGAPTSIVTFTGKAPAQRIRIVGATSRGATLPILTFENCANFSFEGLNFYGERASGATGVINFLGSPDMWVDDCEVSADVLADQFFGGSFTPSNVLGTFQDGERVTVELAGVPNGGTGYFRDYPGISSPTNYVISGPGGLKDGNRSGGTWRTASGTDGQWHSNTSPRTMRGDDSDATCTIGALTNNVTFLVGVYSSTTQPSHRLKVTNCTIHDTKRGVGVSGRDMLIDANTIIDSYAAPIDIAGDCSGSTIRSKCYGVLAQSTDGQPSGTNGPHSSVGGISWGDWIIENVDLSGGIYLVGKSRADAGWGQGYATGWKINDMEGTKTVTCAGDTVTVTSTSGTFTVRVGSRLIGPGFPNEAVVTEVMSGTGGTGTIFRLNTSQTVSTPTVVRIQGRVINSIIRSNIVDANGAIGLQFDYIGTGTICDYNTVISTRDTRLITPTTPQFYYANADTGSMARHNIFVEAALGGSTRYIAEEFLRDSYDNAFLSMGATSGPLSYEANFQGIGGPTPFSGATLDNIVEMLTPIPGSRADGKGATVYWDFDTNTGSFPTDPGSPTTSLVNGVDLPLVQFGGASSMRWTAAGAENLMEMTDTDELTIAMVIDMEGAVGDQYLCTAQNSDVYIRRLPTDGNLRFLFKDVTSGTSQQIDSAFTLLPSDGLLTLCVSVKFSEGRVNVWRGATQDPFVTFNTWTGNPLKVDGNTLTFMGSAGASGFVTAKVGKLLIHDGYLDGDDAAVHTRLVALDGKPADWGSQGELLMGEPVRGLLGGNAAAYNAGMQLGTAPGVAGFVNTGSALTDA